MTINFCIVNCGESVMRIAIIADVLGEENNGTSITVKRLILNLKKRGHEVIVVSPGDEHNNSDGYFTMNKIDFKIFNNYVRENGVEFAKPDLNLLKDLIQKCDVVHALMPFPLGRAAARICKELHKPFTTAFHVQPENVSSHFGLLKSKFVNDCIYKNFLKKFYSYSEYIHCPTEFIADQLRNHNYTQDLRVISNGVDPIFIPNKTEKPDEYKDKFCILSTGRMVKEKCQSELIKALYLSKYSDKIQLFIAGEGPLKNKLAQLGKDLKNPPVMRFFTKDELVQLINTCDLYTQASYAEIECIACLEAITCGLVPIISNSKMSAAKYFALSEHNLYTAGNPQALADKIDYMIEHPQFREKQSAQYIEYAEKFKIEKCIDKMELMFQDAIEGTHRS